MRFLDVVAALSHEGAAIGIFGPSLESIPEPHGTKANTLGSPRQATLGHPANRRQLRCHQAATTGMAGSYRRHLDTSSGNGPHGRQLPGALGHLSLAALLADGVRPEPPS